MDLKIDYLTDRSELNPDAILKYGCLVATPLK